MARKPRQPANTEPVDPSEVQAQEAEYRRRFDKRMQQYAEDYDLEGLNRSNDLATLTILINNELMVEDFQQQIKSLLVQSSVENAGDIKKYADLLDDAISTNSALQRTLGIDRRSRQLDNADSVESYVAELRKNAADFMEKRLIKIYCPDCKVLVGRFAPVHKHTSFTCSVQCSQCGKTARARRDERDVMFDLKDAHWRTKYRAQIVQPQKGNLQEELTSDEEETDNVVIFAEQGPSIENEDTLKKAELSTDVELGANDGSD
jgi:ribosome-binding protein aMBF1 (putative translation factor)